MTATVFLLCLASLGSMAFNVWAVLVLIATAKQLNVIRALVEEALTLYTTEVQERIKRGLQ